MHGMRNYGKPNPHAKIEAYPQVRNYALLKTGLHRKRNQTIFEPNKTKEGH